MQIIRILGIDPGYGRMGWGVIEGKKDKWQYVAHGCIDTASQKRFQDRLVDISQSIAEILDIYQPHVGAVEELFFKKNVTTGLQVAHARGIVLLHFAQKQVKTFEIKPNQIKMAITGYGNAGKTQVQEMMCLHLRLKQQRIQDDAADALAAALTCGLGLRLRTTGA